MHANTFEDLKLDTRLLQALAQEGYLEPTPIQRKAIPVLLDGQDLLATAQTGTGKTAAFSLPLLQRLEATRSAGPARLRALVLTPTRELALQVEGSIRTYGRRMPLSTAVVMGGVSLRTQVQALQRTPDILVATPGRLLDLLGQRKVRLDSVEVLILDEADRMLDMGFIHDVRRIVDHIPRQRQTALFSATLSREVAALASDMLHHPVRVAVTPPASVAGGIAERVMFVAQQDKRSLLVRILNDPEVERALVFTRTKHRAERIMQYIARSGVSAEAIHSNKTQGARQKALTAFDRGDVRVLVATDIVARGIDVEGISHVINYELPDSPESYVHRIGRTARAGAAGVAISLCDAAEVALLREIEKLTRSALTVIEDQPFHSEGIAVLYTGSGPKKETRAGSGAGGWRSFRPGGRRARSRF